jgi:hypothetical protein
MNTAVANLLDGKIVRRDRGETVSHPNCSIQVERVFNPHRQAMLAALRVALDLPSKPTVFREDEK